MVDTITVVVGVLVAILIVALAAAVTWIVAWILRDSRRRRAYERAGVSHLGLYFKDRFPHIVEDFDLVTTRRFDLWAGNVSARLSTLSHDIDLLGTARQGLDSRMDRLEQRIGEIE